jgi:hypothetical protein
MPETMIDIRSLTLPLLRITQTHAQNLHVMVQVAPQIQYYVRKHGQRKLLSRLTMARSNHHYA